MSKLTKLLRNPKQFVVDSKAYRRALLAASRARRMGRAGSSSRAFVASGDAGDVPGAILDDLARSVPAVEVADSTLAVLRSDQALLTEYLFDLGRVPQLLVRLTAGPRSLDVGSASLAAVDDFLRREETLTAHVEVPATSTGISLDIELWRAEAFQVVGPTQNLVARRISHHTVAEQGLFRAGKLTRARDLHACALTTDAAFPVDIVYTWVNHRDPTWQALWSQTVGSPPTLEREDPKSLDRFMNRDELRYSLRSVARFTPWARRIFVVTNCERPAWLGDHPKLIWVDHRHVIPEEHLPTFSSHAIETRLHHIPGLADHFLYLNDDVFLLRPATASDFFEGNGMTKSFMEGFGAVNGAVDPADPDYLNAARNGKRLLEEAFGRSATQLHKHTAIALRKDVLFEMEDRFRVPIQTTTAQRFRSPGDISTVSFLYHHYAYLTHRTVFAPSDAVLVQPQSHLRDELLRELVRNARRPATACLNDGGGSGAHRGWHRRVREFLEAAFPLPCEFEAAGDDLDAAPTREADECPVCHRTEPSASGAPFDPHERPVTTKVH